MASSKSTGAKGKKSSKKKPIGNYEHEDKMRANNPPHGIRHGSMFQSFDNRRDVKDGNDEDRTQEPEVIRAFRDTWDRARRASLEEWIAAVNEHGGFGRWSWAVSFSPSDVAAILEQRNGPVPSN